ncbi:DUF922 domain-containing protein [Niabella soli]|uniref:DUF922 domain-containing protein n=1 Tax=Niabella soli TaxID=446683 RepID=UPI00143BDDAD|nr:hypothetical protein [Niabella soli]
MSDFKVVKEGHSAPESLGGNQAVTRTGFLYTSTQINSGKEKGRNRIKVQALMYPQHSYIRAGVLKAAPSAIAYLMNHEQKHFDISEIYARQAARFLQTHRFTKNYGPEITNEMKRLFKEAAAFQKRYDDETNNGRSRAKQQLWDKYIHEKLKEVSAYSQKDFLLNVQ